MLGDSATVLAEDPKGMGFVDEESRTVCLLVLHDLRQRCDVAFHGEHAVDDDELALAVRHELQLLFEIVRVIMSKLERLAVRKAHAVDDRGVIHLVEDRDVVSIKQAGQDTDVHAITR